MISRPRSQAANRQSTALWMRQRPRLRHRLWALTFGASIRMSSRLRECDATRQHTMTATRMTMFEPLAAARPAVGSSRLFGGEPHSKGAGRTITRAKRRELVGTLARRMRGLELICTVKAKHVLLGPARPRQRKKGRGTMWGVLVLGLGYSILRQYFRGGTYRLTSRLTARTNRAGSLRGVR